MAVICKFCGGPHPWFDCGKKPEGWKPPKQTPSGAALLTDAGGKTGGQEKSAHPSRHGIESEDSASDASRTPVKKSGVAAKARRSDRKGQNRGEDRGDPKPVQIRPPDQSTASRKDGRSPAPAERPTGVMRKLIEVEPLIGTSPKSVAGTQAPPVDTKSKRGRPISNTSPRAAAIREATRRWRAAAKEGK